MTEVQFAVDQRQKGRSSWLRVAREKSAPAADAPAAGPTAGPPAGAKGAT